MESLQKIESEKLKTFSYYKLARIHEKLKQYEEANNFYDSAIRAALMMIDEYNGSQSQAYYYLLGKLFFLGRGAPRNEFKALSFFKTGCRSDDYFYFGVIFSEKCKAKAHLIKPKDIQLQVINCLSASEDSKWRNSPKKNSNQNSPQKMGSILGKL